MSVHPSHETKLTDSSQCDEFCVKCGVTDRCKGDPLSRPCFFAPKIEMQKYVGDVMVRKVGAIGKFYPQTFTITSPALAPRGQLVNVWLRQYGEEWEPSTFGVFKPEEENQPVSDSGRQIGDCEHGHAPAACYTCLRGDHNIVLRELALLKAQFEEKRTGFAQAMDKKDSEHHTEIEEYSEALDQHCVCRFEGDPRRRVEECHYHECQRKVLTENGDPSNMTLLELVARQARKIDQKELALAGALKQLNDLQRQWEDLREDYHKLKERLADCETPSGHLGSDS